MRVLLVVYDNDSYIHWFPQGTAYIAAALRNAGHEVRVYSQDCHHYPDEHLTQYLDANEYDVVGLGIVAGYHQYRRLLGISCAINRSKKRPYYVLGGHGPSPEPHFFLDRTGADAVVIGEGEETIVELLAALSAGTALGGVRGIAFRNGSTTTVNQRRPLAPEVDTIPLPAYDLFPVEYYRLLRMPHASNRDFVMPVLSGRGCTFQCNFCYRMDPGFRPRSSDSIIDEIRLLKGEYGITFVAFSDELLMASEERTASLCEAFLSAQLNVKWDCNGRLNYAKPDVLNLMKRAGCVFINYGIEALDDHVLKNMRKALTTDIIVKGVEATLAAGISPGLNVLFGNLGDNHDTLNKAVAFLLKYDDAAQMRTIRPVTPYPGSPLYYHAIQEGLLRDCRDFYESKHANSDLVSVNFTDLSDDDFHHALLNANSVLIRNHFSNRVTSVLSEAEALYKHRHVGFRGFRQS